MTRILLPLLALVLSATGLHAQTWTLRQCIDHALEHNLTVRRTAVSVESSKVELANAKTDLLPSLSASASQGFSFGRGLTMNNTYANRSTSNTGLDLGASVQLYTGGRLTTAIRTSRLNLQAALADLAKARDDIALQVTSAYLDVLYQRELTLVARHQLDLAAAQLERQEALLQGGKTSEAEVAEARSTVMSDSLTLVQQQGTLALSLLDLSQMLELPTPDGFDVAAPDDSPILARDTQLLPPAQIYDAAAEQRPEVQAEQFRLQSAEQAIRAARAGYLPTLSLNGGLGSSYYKTSGFAAESFSSQLKNNFSQSVSLGLSIPLFDHFSTRHAVRQARLQAENQRLSLQTTRQTLYKEIQQAYYNALTAHRSWAASEASDQAAAAALRLMQAKYENGKATPTEFAEAKTRATKAAADLLQAKYTFLFRQKILNFYRGLPLA